MIVFHDVDKEYGFLSNWYLSVFHVDGRRFTSVEQYLMWRKALLFGDTARAEAIHATDDPAKIKELGRKVKPYDDRVWDGFRQTVLYEALLAKFRDDPKLLRGLLATGDEVLAEGSRHDKVFANGLYMTDPDRFDMQKWQGRNLLGFTLMAVREKLRPVPVKRESIPFGKLCAADAEAGALFMVAVQRSMSEDYQRHMIPYYLQHSLSEDDIGKTLTAIDTLKEEFARLDREQPLVLIGGEIVKGF